MIPKFKNIIIFAIVAIIFVLIYIFFVNKDPNEDLLLTSDGVTPSVDNAGFVDPGADPLTQNFLSLLLGVQSIKLDDSIFKDGSYFFNLSDSSIVLIPDGTEGRPNPFAPIGSDVAPITTPTPSTPASEIDQIIEDLN